MRRLIRSVACLTLSLCAIYALFTIIRILQGEPLVQALDYAHHISIVWFLMCSVLIFLVYGVKHSLGKNNKHNDSTDLLLKIFAALVALFFGLLVWCGYLLVTEYTFASSTLANYAIIVGILFCIAFFSIAAGVGVYFSIRNFE